MTTATTHKSLICCGCGSKTELLQRVEGHRFCLECSSSISTEVWVRFRQGIEQRPGSEGPAHSALLDILEEGTWWCEKPLAAAPCSVPPMRLMLVAGFYEHDRPADWVLVALYGDLTVDPLNARLFTRSPAGCQLGFTAARRWTEVLGGNGPVVPFVARVLVTGPPGNPESVIEAWRFERDDPPCSSGASGRDVSEL